MPAGITCCSIRISACVLRYVSVASAARTKNTFLGVEHVPREPSFEGGWEIDKQVEAMALLVERGVVSRVGHFKV